VIKILSAIPIAKCNKFIDLGKKHRGGLHLTPPLRVATLAVLSGVQFTRIPVSHNG
jgi:hypothetical protein